MKLLISKFFVFLFNLLDSLSNLILDKTITSVVLVITSLLGIKYAIMPSIIIFLISTNFNKELLYKKQCLIAELLCQIQIKLSLEPARLGLDHYHNGRASIDILKRHFPYYYNNLAKYTKESYGFYD